MDPVTAAAFVVGAFVGAPLRYLVDEYVSSTNHRTLPLGTFTVNVAGSAILGVVFAVSDNGWVSDPVELAIGTAFCGALTTFSTFAFEVVRLIEDGARRSAVATVALNTIGAIAAGGFTYVVVGAMG